MPKEFPRLPGLEGIGPVLRFGRHAIGIHVFGQIGRHAPEIVIGRALGMAPVGFFNRANGLNELFNRAVLRAALPLCLPYLAAEVRHGRELRSAYARTLASLTAVGWPALVLLALLAFPAIRVLYGGQWDASVPLARLLCIAAAVETTYWLATEALIAGGNVRAGHSLQVWRQCARIAGLLAGVPFGLVGACWGLLAGTIAGSVLSHRALVAHIGLSLRLVAAACAQSLAVVAISTGPTALWALVGRIDEGNYVVVAAACVTSFCILWPVSLRLLGHPLWGELRNLRRHGDLT
jgi:O-antigen/teichoic acid export membrane protein